LHKKNNTFQSTQKINDQLSSSKLHWVMEAKQDMNCKKSSKVFHIQIIYRWHQFQTQIIRILDQLPSETILLLPRIIIPQAAKGLLQIDSAKKWLIYILIIITIKCLFHCNSRFKIYSFSKISIFRCRIQNK